MSASTYWLVIAGYTYNGKDRNPMNHPSIFASRRPSASKGTYVYAQSCRLTFETFRDMIVIRPKPKLVVLLKSENVVGLRSLKKLIDWCPFITHTNWEHTTRFCKSKIQIIPYDLLKVLK